jgi:hypothetical protein
MSSFKDCHHRASPQMPRAGASEYQEGVAGLDRDQGRVGAAAAAMKMVEVAMPTVILTRLPSAAEGGTGEPLLSAIVDVPQIAWARGLLKEQHDAS